jgi:hypothetical protein
MKKIIVLVSILSTIIFAEKSALYKAVDSQDLVKVKQELKKVKNIEERNAAGHTLLMTAAGWDNKEIVTLLVNNGADIHACSSRGTCVIHRAAMSRNPEILKYIISKGADVNRIYNKSCVPLDNALRYVALQGHGLENLKTLLDNGAKKVINKKCRGYTPLMVSVKNTDVIKLLLDNGADKNIKTRSGKTAFDLANEYNAPSSVIEMLSINKTIKKVDVSKKDKGLIWEKKTTHNRYDNYTAEKAQEYCQKLNWKNKSDWRVPTLKEYENILLEEPITDFVINGISKYYMDPKEFPNLLPLRFWAKDQNGNIVYLSIATKRSGKVCPSCQKNLIRCVRGM